MELDLWPDVTRFYGISPRDLAEIPRNILRVYVDAIPRLEAQEQLRLVHVASFPHMKESARNSYERQLMLTAGMPIPQPTRARSREDLEGNLAGMGIGVRFVGGEDDG